MMAVLPIAGVTAIFGLYHRHEHVASLIVSTAWTVIFSLCGEGSWASCLPDCSLKPRQRLLRMVSAHTGVAARREQIAE